MLHDSTHLPLGRILSVSKTPEGLCGLEVNYPLKTFLMTVR